MLPLTFADPADYDKIDANDKVSLLGLADLTPGKPVECKITRPDGPSFSITLNHSCNEQQIMVRCRAGFTYGPAGLEPRAPRQNGAPRSVRCVLKTNKEHRSDKTA